MPACPAASRGLGRLVAAADFERVLGERSRAATGHFSVHHLKSQPCRPATARDRTARRKLSTIEDRAGAYPVDDFRLEGLPGPRIWVGAVVPKRHAKRAVTRSLLKRQIYAATARHQARLSAGLWIVRLRAPFDRGHFQSAASAALRRDARSELDALLVAATAEPR